MNKDKTILKLIERLKRIVDFNLIKIVDYWDGDLCAIGLRKTNKLVYISTCNYIDSGTNKYDYILDILDEFDETKYETVKEVTNVSEDELNEEVKSFLDI